MWADREPAPSNPWAAVTSADGAECLWDTAPEAESPLTKDMVEGALLSARRGAVKVRLWEDWPRLLRRVGQWGEILVVTRNALAAVGAHQTLTDLVFSGGVVATNPAGDLSYDFRRWHSAEALHQVSERGHVLAVEFREPGGEVFHRLVLTPRSEVETFFSWVRCHQWDGVSRPVRRHCSACQRQALGLNARENEPELRAGVTVGLDAVYPLLATAVEERLHMRTLVGSAGALQVSTLAPENLIDHGHSWFAGDGHCGFHLAKAGPARVEIGALSGLDAAPETLAVRGTLPDGRFSFLLLPADEASRARWNEACLDLL